MGHMSPETKNGFHIFFVVFAQSLSHDRLLLTPWTAACQAPLSSTISQSLLKFMPTELVMLSNHIISYF